MKDILYTFHAYPLDTVKVKLSRLHATSNASTFKHHDNEKLPAFTYNLGEGKNLKVNSKLLTDKKDELLKFKNNFWQTKNKDGLTYQREYEDQLYSAVRDAINNLTDEWNEKYVKEVNKNFKD